MSGRPVNAQNISVMRPFSRRCATVSIAAAVRSRYATVCVVEHRNVSSPLGEQLT